MGHTLLAGPWVGEWGYEVACWVPHLRYVARRYKNVIVGTRPGNDYLYADFATKIYHFKADNFTDRFMNHGAVYGPPKKIWRHHPKAQILMPNWAVCISKHREYCCYGQHTQYQNGIYDIIIHARSATKYKSANRNWPVKYYQEVLKHFPKLKAASVGTDAYHIPGTEDKRGVKLVDLCSMLRLCKLVIGPSSGTMHLAHMCQAPLLVWTGREKQKCIKANNRKRYEKLWRAFDTPVHVLDAHGWCPNPKWVIRAMEGIL